MDLNKNFWSFRLLRYQERGRGSLRRVRRACIVCGALELDQPTTLMPNGKRRARLAARQKAELAAFTSRGPPGPRGGKPMVLQSDLLRCDWRCGGCFYYNYGGNSACRRCAAPRQFNGGANNVHGVYRGRPMDNVGQTTVAQQFPADRLTDAGLYRTPGPQFPLQYGHLRRTGNAPNIPTRSGAQQYGNHHKSGDERQHAQEPRREPARSPEGPSWAEMARRSPTAQQNSGQPDVRSGRNQPDPPGRTASAGGHTGANEGDNNLEQTAREGQDDRTDAYSLGEEDELREEPNTWDLHKHLRALAFKKQRRVKKLHNQQAEVNEQSLYIEEQRRRLATMQFEVDETKEDIRELDEQSAATSKLYSELLAAESNAHNIDEAQGLNGQEDEEGAAVVLQQVADAMRNYSSIRSPAIRQMLGALVLQIQELQAQYSPEAAPADQSPNRSPPPRSPSPVIHQTVPSIANVVPPTTEPTSQMVQEAAAALESDAMWEDPRRTAKRKKPEAEQEPAAGDCQNRFAPIADEAIAQTRQRALAICDRPSPHRRGRSSGASLARSRDRKGLYQELQQQVEQQKKATLG